MRNAASTGFGSMCSLAYCGTMQFAYIKQLFIATAKIKIRAFGQAKVYTAILCIYVHPIKTKCAACIRSTAHSSIRP